jgi:hypothetical protein
MQNFDHNIGFLGKRQFFRRKLQKIVIITSTHGSVEQKLLGPFFSSSFNQA